MPMIDEMKKGFELPVTAAADVGEFSVGLNRQGGVAEEGEDCLDKKRPDRGGGADARGASCHGWVGGCVAESKMMAVDCAENKQGIHICESQNLQTCAKRVLNWNE